MGRRIETIISGRLTQNERESGADLREKLEDGRKAKKDKSGPSNIVHNHYY